MGQITYLGDYFQVGLFCEIFAFQGVCACLRVCLCVCALCVCALCVCERWGYFLEIFCGFFLRAYFLDFTTIMLIDELVLTLILMKLTIIFMNTTL